MRAPATVSTRCAVKRLRFSATLAHVRCEILLKLQVATHNNGTMPARPRKNTGEISHNMIDATLQRITALSADHFNAHPDEVNWGHVGTLNHYRAKLREITDMAFREGEHAE